MRSLFTHCCIQENFRIGKKSRRRDFSARIRDEQRGNKRFAFRNIDDAVADADDGDVTKPDVDVFQAES